jgi:hypothetical protein
MGRPTKAIHEGNQVDAEELKFEVVGPQQIVIQIEDGTELKIFVTPAKVVKLKDVYNEEGEPSYQVKWGTGITASVPVELLRPKTAKQSK